MRGLLCFSSLLVAAVSAACVVSPERPDEQTASSSTVASPLETACTTDTECDVACERFVRETVDVRYLPRYDVARCELATLATAGETAPPAVPSCLCAQRGTEAIDLLSPASPDPCVAYGRDRACLYTRNEIPTCDPRDPDRVCPDVCRDLEQRYLIDAAQGFHAEVRDAVCESRACRCVLEIGESCFVDHWANSIDCRLTTAQMLGEIDAVLGAEDVQPDPAAAQGVDVR